VPSHLKDTFTEFCASISGAERIDALLIPPYASDRADVFFANRRVICEIKALETDTNDKIVRLLNKEGISLPEGQHVLTEVVKGHPSASSLERKAFAAVTAPVSRALEKANSQIRDTKTIFGIDDADGIVVFLHGSVHVLTPDVILARVRQRLRKRHETTRSGPAHDQITWVILFSELHAVKLYDGLVAPIIPLRNAEVPEKFGSGAIVDHLIAGWADWNRRPMQVVHASALR